MKKWLIWLSICFSLVNLYAQKQGTYQGLLWEISGNGLQKPSYLFGTMHVSKKMVFHLGEPWFNAIDSVDIVAMEMNPETWMSDFIESDMVNKSMSSVMRMGRGRNYLDLYKAPYKIGRERLNYIANSLSEDPEIVNSIMYRYQGYDGDGEEDSWLDMYIYQTGKKLGKEATGLESFEESMKSLQKSYMPDEDEGEDKKSYYKKYSKTYELTSQLNVAYRNGDLDLLDSIYNKISTKNTLKYLINERNERFVKRMDSIMKTKSLFTGVGAAHLAGDMGVINLLRKMGYKVRSIPVGERDAVKKKKLEETIIKLPFTRYYTSDSTISVETPLKPLELFSSGASKMELAADLINSTHYTISRIKTYANIIGETKQQTWKLIDSLLYDNVPGKLLEQKETTVDGYKAVDLKTRSRKGHVIYIRLIQLPEEILVLKVSAPDEKIIDEFGERFVKSVQIHNTAKAEWQRFTFPDKTFSVELPEKPVFYGKNMLSAMLLSTDILATDEKTGTDFYLSAMPEGQLSYMEEDTFALSVTARDFAKSNDLKEVKRQLITYKGYKTLKVNYTAADKRNVDVMYVLQNMMYYVAAAYYNKQSPAINRFFESMEFALPEYKEFYDITDTTVYMTSKVPYKPKDDIFSMGSRSMWAAYGNNKVDTNEAIIESNVFQDKDNNESIQVEIFKNSRYYKMESEKDFKRLAKLYASDFGDYTITKEKEQKLPDGTLQLDFYISDTNSVKTARYKILLKNQTKFVVSANVDPVLGESKFVTTFFDSFKPIDSLTGKDVFSSKADLLFKDIYSTDTNLVNAAISGIYDLMPEVRHIPEFTKLAKNLPAQARNPVNFKSMMYRKLGKTGDKSVIPFLKAEYALAGDTADYQFAILRGLALMKTAEGIQAYKELVLTETPFGGQMNTDYMLFGALRDSMKLSAALYPDLFQLLSIDEYESGVYELLADMVDSNAISPSAYKDKLPIILNEAKINLKRVLANVEEKSYYDDDYSEGSDLAIFNRLLLPYYDQPNVKAHFDKIFTTDNKALKLSTLTYMISKGKKADTAVINNLAADDEHRIDLYEALLDIKKPELFPTQWKTADHFAKGLLMSSYTYSVADKDSVELLETRKMEWKGKKGTIYIYKYKADDYDSDGYEIAIIGLLPLDNTGKMPVRNEFYGADAEEIDEDKKLDEQINETLVSALRSSRQNNYSQYYYDIEDEEYTHKYNGYDD